MKAFLKALLILAAITFTSNSQAVMYLARPYDPNLARWISRDPLGEDGGQNLYGFVAGDPINAVDPLGLEWKVNRAQSSQADATSDCKDSVDDLAKKIGLDPGAYTFWLEPADGSALPATSSEKMATSRKFRIPNTVYAYWAGELGGFGKWWVHWNPRACHALWIGVVSRRELM